MGKKSLYDLIHESLSIELKHSDAEYSYSEIDYIFDVDGLDKDLLRRYNAFPIKMLAESTFDPPFTMNEDLTINPIELTPIKTYSYEEILRYKYKMGLDDGFIKALITLDKYEAANKIEVVTLIVNKFDNLDFVKKCMTAFGWEISHYNEGNIFGIDVLKAHFNPIFQNAVNDEIKENPMLMHWTPAYNYGGILKNGLLPKSDNSKYSYSPRVHLIKQNVSDEEKLGFGKILCNANKDPRNDRNYVLLNVDTKKIPYKIDFFYDPRYEFGYYTKDKICKEALSKNKEIKF